MNNVSVFRNDHTISARVAEIMSKLPEGHTRAEAFSAINRAKIVDKNGELIKPSLWYHMLAYSVKTNGKTTMSEMYPDFIATPSPYQRLKHKVVEAPRIKETVNIEKEELQDVLATISDLTRKVNSIMYRDNSIHSSIHSNDRTGTVSKMRRNA